MGGSATTKLDINDREVSFRIAVVRLIASLVRPAGVPATVKFVAIIFLALAVFGSFVAVLFLASWGTALEQHKDFDCRLYLAYYTINSLMMLLLAIIVIPKLQESAETKQFENKMGSMFAKKAAALGNIDGN
jgi:hypothetical protein